MCPEWAFFGTVTSRPELGLPAIAKRRCAAGCAAGETRLMRAPGDLGKATTMPGARPTPSSSSVPCAETWWGLPLQWAAGTQLTLWMRTLVTCGEGDLTLAVGEPPLPAVEAGAARRLRATRRLRAAGVGRHGGGRGRGEQRTAAARWLSRQRTWIACGRLCSPRPRTPSSGTTLRPSRARIRARPAAPDVIGYEGANRILARKLRPWGRLRRFLSPSGSRRRRARGRAGWPADRRVDRAG